MVAIKIGDFSALQELLVTRRGKAKMKASCVPCLFGSPCVLARASQVGSLTSCLVSHYVGVPVQQKIYVGDLNQSDPRRRAYVDVNGDRQALSGTGYDDAESVVRVVASRNHGGERLEGYLTELASQFTECRRRSVGSSLKLCVLAEGGADVYPRLGPTSEWDIGAAQAVLTAAGGGVYTPDGKVLAYNTKESLLNPEFLAVGDASYPWSERLPAFPAL